jgi:hypothetical protein
METPAPYSASVPAFVRPVVARTEACGVPLVVRAAPWRLVRQAGAAKTPDEQAELMLSCVAECVEFAVTGQRVDPAELPIEEIGRLAGLAIHPGRSPDSAKADADFTTPPAPSGSGGSASPAASETPPPG